MAARRCLSTSSRRKCVAYRLGLVEYETAWMWQKELIQQRFVAQREGRPLDHDVVLMLQHPSVYTLGRGATMDNVKFDVNKDDCKLLRVDRGGEVTYHGPGQLVVYPILDLNYYNKDLHWYLRQVEQVVIDTLAEVGIRGERLESLTGVWVDDQSSADGSIHSERDMKKIAAVGTHASKWITMHGFAINVTTDLKAFDRIIPCGIDDRAVTSIECFLPGITLSQVEAATLTSMTSIFNVDMTVKDSATPFSL